MSVTSGSTLTLNDVEPDPLSTSLADAHRDRGQMLVYVTFEELQLLTEFRERKARGGLTRNRG